MSTPATRSAGERAGAARAPAVGPGEVVATTSPRRRRRSGTRPHPALYLFPVPALVLYAVFFAVPTVQAFQYAATDWDGFSADFAYVGIDNVVRATTADDLFTNALVNNLQFMLVVVVAQTALSLALAVLLAGTGRGSVLLRGLFFFPTILSSVSVAFIWKFIYDPNFGLANQLTGALGLDVLQSAFLGNPAIAIYCVAVAQVWFHTGQMMVIYVAGLQQVPREMLEAAEVDGAVGWARFRHITWPLIAPATAIVVAYTTVQSFKAFDLILGISGNPPQPSLDILSTRIYAGFANTQFGYAAAESVIFMAVIAVVVWLQRRGLRLTQATS